MTSDEISLFEQALKNININKKLVMNDRITNYYQKIKNISIFKQ